MGFTVLAVVVSAYDNPFRRLNLQPSGWESIGLTTEVQAKPTMLVKPVIYVIKRSPARLFRGMTIPNTTHE